MTQQIPITGTSAAHAGEIASDSGSGQIRISQHDSSKLWTVGM